MLAGVDWGAHNVAVICMNRGWREAAHLRFPPRMEPVLLSLSAACIYGLVLLASDMTLLHRSAQTQGCSDIYVIPTLSYVLM